MAKQSAYSLVGSIFDTDIISLLRPNGDGTFTNYTVNFAATKAAQTVTNLDSLSDVDLAIAAGDRQALCYDLTTSSWKAGKLVPVVTTKTASAILALTDISTSARGVVRMNSATAVSLTVPPETTANFPIGTQIEVTMTGAGLVTIAAGAGVTVNNAAGLVSSTQHQKGLLTKTAADNWNFAWVGSGSGSGSGGVPTGGTVGQTLVKQSGTNGDAVWAGVGNTVGAPAAGPHAYWRIRYRSGNHGTFLSAFDIQFRQTAGVTEHPTGGTVLEFHTRGGFAGSDAFDANDATRWALDDYANIGAAYLGYHYATPISVAQVRMFVNNGETPNSYDIDYSDDGAVWTTALAVTGQTNWATEVLHTMPLQTTVGLTVPLSGLSDAVIASPSDGQVLTYEAATSKWKNKAATGGSGGGGGTSSSTFTPVYKGARVTLTGAPDIPSTTWTPIGWAAAARDTNGFWSSGSPTRLTIPAGVTKVKLRGSFWTHESRSLDIGISFWKNGAAVDGSASNQMTGGNWAFRSASTDVFDVVAGDYFQMVVFTSAVTSVYSSPDTWFALEVVEGSVLNQTLTGGGNTNVAAYCHATGLSSPVVSDSKNATLTRLAAGIYKFAFSTPIPAHCVPSFAATFNNDAADDTGLYCSISRSTAYSADPTWLTSIIINTRRHTDGTLLDPQNLRMSMTDPTALIGASGASSTAPASATATGTVGMTAFDANYFYVCIATNTWKRTALATW